MRIKEVFPGLDDINGKRVSICGAGVLGLCVFGLFQQEGIEVCGFIDRQADSIDNIEGVKAYNCEFLSNLDQKNTVVVIAVTRTADVNSIIALIEKSNKYLAYKVVQGGDVYIDISGVCNLKCASCPNGNNSKDVFTKSPRGFMNKELFEKIIDKIIMELPSKKLIHLYNFGDPMLSPHIYDIIDVIHERNMFAVVSTNLSTEVDFNELAKHCPDLIKVSLSGFTQQVYQTTHNGGNIILVKSNLYKLRYMLNKCHSKSKVIIGYHAYKNNGGEEERRMAELSAELGFFFQVKKGVYFNNRKLLGLDNFEEKDISFINNYCIDGEKYFEIATNKQGRDSCSFLDDKERSLFIDWDGSVTLCCSFHTNESVFPYSYLEVPIEKIQKDRCSHQLCKECMEHGICF